MKILILGTEARYRAYQPDMPFIGRQELVFLDKDSTEDTILAAGGDAEVLFVDAITPVSGALMERMPSLRMVHSEGVAFDRIDLAAARDRGIYVCNNKGCNAGAVAEQAILLMLMLLRRALEGDRAVREGRQMEMKERCMVEGLTELSATDAMKAYAMGGWDGIGIRVASGIGAIDIDHCIREDGTLNDVAASVLGIFKDAYFERSPSGSGLRGFFRVDADYIFDKTVYYINNRSKAFKFLSLQNRKVIVVCFQSINRDFFLLIHFPEMLLNLIICCVCILLIFQKTVKGNKNMLYSDIFIGEFFIKLVICHLILSALSEKLIIRSLRIVVIF